jgi:hypothetical protein
MFGLDKQTIKQKKSAQRKKHLQDLITRFSERKIILQIEIEKIEIAIQKTQKELTEVLKEKLNE